MTFEDESEKEEQIFVEMVNTIKEKEDGNSDNENPPGCINSKL